MNCQMLEYNVIQKKSKNVNFLDSDHNYFTVVSHLHFSWNKLANHKGIQKYLILMYSGHTHTHKDPNPHTLPHPVAVGQARKTHTYTHTGASHQ